MYIAAQILFLTVSTISKYCVTLSVLYVVKGGDLDDS